MKIGMLAGEASGDLLGGKLIEALRKRYPDLQVEGIGGPAMIAAGCKSLYDIELLAVMGFIEPLMRLPSLIKLRRDLSRHFLNNPPDIFIGIDAPDFNLGLEKILHDAGIPTVHYVSPSVWAWRQYRIRKIAKAVDLMVTLLPFEAEFYKSHQVPVCYAGHPLAEQIPVAPDKLAARRSLGLDTEGTYVALLPGSRKQEVHYLAEPFLLAAKIAHEKNPALQFVTSHINEKRYQTFYEAYQRIAPALPLKFFTHRSQDVMTASDAAIITSGTATLEAMLCKCPMVIVYRMSAWTHWLAKRLVKSKYIGLPNLLANELVVPELIQEAATPDSIANAVMDFILHPEKSAALRDRFTLLHEQLKVDTDTAVIEAILACASSSSINNQ